MKDIIKIQFTSRYCTIIGGLDENTEESLYKFLSFHPTGYFFSPKYQDYVQAVAKNEAIVQRGYPPLYNLSDYNLFWDGYKRLYSKVTKRFRPGLLTRVVEYLTSECDREVEVLGKPEPTSFEFNLQEYENREYQVRVAREICSQRFGIVKSPPRSGKTIIFMLVVASEQKYPVIFFCRSLDIASQTVEKIRAGLPKVKVGFVGDGEADVQDITVITVQSAFSAFDKKYKVEKAEKPEKQFDNIQKKREVRKLISRAQIVFYDEAHHSGAITSKMLLGKCEGASMVVGLTATPFNGTPEDILVEEAIGPVIQEISYSELIKEGFLVAPTIYMYYLPKLSLPETATYNTIYKRAVVDNKFFHLLIKKLVKILTAKGKSVVVQTTQVRHAQLLAKELGAVLLVGTQSEKDATGKVKRVRTKTMTRDEVRHKLINKEELCVVSTLLSEGVDLPSLDYTINAAGNKSEIEIIQRMRSITKSDKKDFAGVIDFYHQNEYLRQHSRKRLKIYNSEPEFTVIKRDVRHWTIEDVE